MTESTSITPDSQPFNLKQHLDRVLEQLGAAAIQNSVTLSLHLEPDLPSTLAGRADILEQLVNGQIKALLAHGATAEISLQASEICCEESSLELCFSISSSVHDKEFLQATIDEQETLLSELGGEIFFEHIPDKGSIIQFTAAFTVPCGKLANQPSSLSILLVDDVQINLELGRIVMEKQGHTVTTAGNGAEALEAFQANRFDMIFMDVQMPVMDGFQATEAIRASEKSRGGHIPIIAMTAYATIGDRNRCLEAGMDSYISKPVRPGEIVEIIRQFASSHVEGFAEQEQCVVQQTEAVEAMVFNRAELLERLGGRNDLIPRFTAMFRESASTSLKLLQDAITAGISDDVHRQAHTIKGAAANIGAARIRAIAQQLDECAKSGDLAPAPALLAELNKEFNLFCTEVENQP